MTTASSSESNAPAYDNKGQYSRVSILRYEKIFGPGYISTGGHDTTEYLCGKVADALKPGNRVLDVGSGIGGAMFHLARTYGVEVTGVDLASEMIAIAHDRAQEAGSPPGVTSILGDVLTYDLPLDNYDVVWSRDALMHVPDKNRLFQRLHSLNKPGGRLVITDYAKGVGQRSPEFHEYIEKTGYHVVDPAAYGKLLSDAGYRDVVVEDATDRFVAILKRELDLLDTNRSDFLASFSEEDLNYLVARWKMKIGFCQDGDMKWGIYTATR
jgi:phosphoethanolamine N-methyltransferase